MFTARISLGAITVLKRSNRTVKYVPPFPFQS